MTTNGQAPFITVFMYLGEARNPQEKADLAIIIEETIRQRYQGVKNEAGVWITPAFPKLIYVLEEDNIRPGAPYYYLTELAAKCTAKRMVPDYISEKKMLEMKVDKNGEGHCYTCMGCRSFLTPYVDPETGKPKYYGRFNQGVVTINLVDVALSSGGNFDKFWKIFDERLALCHTCTAGPPPASAGHPQRCRTHPVAVRRTGPPEKRREDRQAAVWRLLHHQPGLCRPV